MSPFFRHLFLSHILQNTMERKEIYEISYEGRTWWPQKHVVSSGLFISVVEYLA